MPALLRPLSMASLAGLLCLSGCGGGAPSRAPGGRVLAGTHVRPNRAYSGAPPVIPHPVRALGRGDCLACHEHGDARDGDAFAARTPHPELTRCVQCHLERRTTALFAPTAASRGFYSLGHRQQPLGPWLIPHPLTMREDCLACHGERTTPAALRTSHPERTRCLQCHLPASSSWPGPRPGVMPGGAARLTGAGATPHNAP